MRASPGMTLIHVNPRSAPCVIDTVDVTDKGRHVLSGAVGGKASLT
jgi:hypothetical protein